MKKFMTRDGDKETLDAFIALALGGLAANPQAGTDMMKAMIVHQTPPTDLIGQSAVGLAVGAMRAREAYLSAREQSQGQGGPATNGGKADDVQPGGEQLADPPPGPGGQGG